MSLLKVVLNCLNIVRELIKVGVEVSKLILNVVDDYDLSIIFLLMKVICFKYDEEKVFFFKFVFFDERGDDVNFNKRFEIFLLDNLFYYGKELELKIMLLMIVCVKGDYDLVKVLLKVGVDVNLGLIFSMLFILVCRGNNLDLIGELLKVGVNIDLEYIKFICLIGRYYNSL